VCDTWRSSFARFLADMGRRPTPQHSIERIDGDADYSPGNCRWATRQEQAANRRSSVMLTLGGETMCVSGWARRVGAEVSTIYYRLAKGWPPTKAVFQPARQYTRKTS
jgi:hypothetical protein